MKTYFGGRTIFDFQLADEDEESEVLEAATDVLNALLGQTFYVRNAQASLALGWKTVAFLTEKGLVRLPVTAFLHLCADYGESAVLKGLEG